MTKLKKSLSVLLTLAMLFTTLCFFPIDLALTKAEAAVSGIKIVVPETIYLTPSSGASTTGQYYVNNNSDGSVKTAYDTSASVAVTYPGAKLESVSSSNADIGAISGLNGTTLGSSAATASGAITLNSGLNAGSTALVEWTFVFTVNGKTQTHYAYSVAYAPWYQPVGAAAKAKGAYHNTFASSILWVSGVHGYSDGDSNSRWYIQTANFIPMLGIIKAPGNNNPDTNWIQSGSNGLSPTVNYQEVEAGGTKYHARANSISPTANLTVDTSRYSNFNQIPNFSVGFMVTDRENANEGPTWYVSDFTGQTSSYYNGTATGSSEYSGDFNSSGTQFSSGDDTSTGIKYNGTWNKAISGTASFRIKSAVKTKTNKVIDTTAWNNNFVNISVTGANKSTLRTSVMNGTSYAKENYTSATWNEYYSALKAAATNLGNPVSATVDTSALTTKEADLKTTVYFNGNGGSVSAASDTFVIGGNKTASYTATATATRAGYIFKGWATTPNATTGSTSLTLGFNQTVYAVWQPKIVFDNLIDLKEWKGLSPGNATVSDFTDTGFTLTSNEGVGEGTYSSPFFPVEPGKSYRIDIDYEGTAWDVYIFFCNEAGGWVDFADGASNRVSYGATTGVPVDNAVFTAPDKAEVVKAQIRVDANGSNNTVKFDNIRVYEVGKVQDDVSYVPSQGFDYGTVYGDKLPEPTRFAYFFDGWVDENGNKIAADATVDFSTIKYLYSTWVPGEYTLTFDTDGGNSINSVTGAYNEAYTKPQDPVKTGYKFMGWSPALPDTIPAVDSKYTATWSENSYAVFFDGNGFTGGTAPEQINTTYTGTVTFPECTYTKNGYTFVGWNTKSDGSGVTYNAGQTATKLTDVRDGGVTLYAMWEETPYTITYVYDNGTGETKVVPFDISETLTSLTAPEKEGYTFAGWKVTSAEGSWTMGDVVGENVTVEAGIMFGNATLTAQWTINQYTITFDTLGGSAVAPITGDYNSDVTAPAAPTKAGYTFAGWENLPAKMPSENITVKAIWTANDYDVQYNANGGEGSVETQSFSYENTVTLRENAFVKTGYHFLGWALSADGEAEYAGGQSDIAALTTEADGVVTLYAVWEKNTYTVTFDKNDAAAEGAMTAQSFKYDEAQALTAIGYTKEGYTFTGWNTLADGNGTAYENGASVENLTAENGGNVTLYAQWTINLYDVTFRFFLATGTQQEITLEDIPHGTAFSALTIPDTFVTMYYDAEKTLPEDNTAHYIFKEWANKTEVITSDIEFVAEYEAQTHRFTPTAEDKAASCTSAGLEAKQCLDCGYSYKKVIPMLEHSWYETDRTATCTAAGYINYKCRNCVGTKQEVLAALGHTEVGGRWEVTTPAGCITEGVRSHYCGRCNTVYETENFPALGHSFTDTAYKAPDCVNTGNKAYRYCSVCELYFAADADRLSAEGKATNEAFILPADGHKTVLVEAVPAECEKDGNIAYYTCENCELLFSDAEATVIISLADTVDPMKGHDYEATVTPPTCTNEGYTTYVCKNDSTHTYVDNYETALGHKAGDAVTENDKPASCTEDGSYDEVVYCSVCKTELSRVKKTHTAPGHTEAKKQETITEATCTVPGDYYDITYCSVCDEELGRVEVTGQTLPHTYTEQLTDEAHLKSEATCNAYAVYYYDCIYCSANAKDEADKDNYTFSYTAGGYDADNHIGTTTTADEDIVPGTCINEKTWNEVTRCDDCGEIITSVPKEGDKDENNHTGETEIRQEDVVAGTCTSEKTWNDVTYCLDCGKAIKTEARTGEKDPAVHSTTETVLKDDKAATCCEDGFTGNMYCADCDKIVTSGTTIPATKDNHAGGVKTEKEDVVPGTCMSKETWNDVTYCVGCGDKLSSVPATGEKNPQNHTGNNTVTTTNEKPATCTEPNTWTEVTVCECGVTVKTEDKTGEIDSDAHTGGTYTGKIDEFYGNCMTEAHWTLVTYCSDCHNAIHSEDQTGAVNPNVHTGNNTVVKEDVVAGTCTSEESWNDVTYCECGEKLSSVPAKGEKDADNHTGTPDKTVGYLAPTCKDEGYTGDTHYTCCDALYAEGTAIPTSDHTPSEAVIENKTEATCTSDGSYDEVVYCSVCKEQISSVTKTIVSPGHIGGTPVRENEVKVSCTTDGSYDEVVYCTVCTVEVSRVNRVEKTQGHTPAAAVKENEIPATEEVDGSYDSVVYCSVCGHEISRTTVYTKVERTITFVMKDKTVEIKAYNGDTITPPEVEGYKGADGFNYKFVKWDKTVSVVYGDATYTAIYNKPADWSALDNLEETLNEVLESGEVDEALLEENKKEIESVLNMIAEVNKDRDTLDTTGQSRIEYIAGKVSDLIDVIYPDAGSVLVIEGSSIFYTGGVISLKAVKMPLGQIINDVTWVSSDEDIVFWANGKLYAVGTGTVTLTATRGIHKASKTIEVINGGETRGITFTALSNAKYIIEDYKEVKNSTILYWSNEQVLRFRVNVNTSYIFDDYIVYINGAVAEPDENGYYYIEAKTGDVLVNVAGALTEEGDDGQGGTIVTKWSFWDWLIQLFRKIGDFFRGLFS